MKNVVHWLLYVEEDPWMTDQERNSSRGGIADADGVGQSFVHSIIRGERLALDDADTSCQAA